MTMQLEGALSRLENKIHSDLAETRDRLNQLEQGRSAPRPEPMPSGLGAQFLKAFTENRELFEKTRSVRLQIKAAGDPITTSSGRQVISGGVGAPGSGVLGLQNALPSRSNPGATTVEYSRFTGLQGAAAQQAAEGDGKSAVRADHTLVAQASMTIAGYCKLSRQALSDSAELRRSIDVTLARAVGAALDDCLVAGGTGFAGFEALATSYTSLVYSGMVDAISEGVSFMQVAGFQPDVVAFNPVDWLAVLVKTGVANDHYLSGDYLGAMPMEMRGLRVVLSPGITSGKGLLLDTSQSELVTVDDFSVEVAYSGDDFTKNLVTVLGELRVAPVFRAVGSARLITPKA
jgi:hypothetical protein